MPNNNNYIPKENLAKVETIQQIETNLPTYEEFINKKSQLSLAARKKIINKSGSNYQSPLIDKNISEIKGYGPCSWNNPNCSCYLSQGYTPLRMACPGSSNTVSFSWFHSNNGYLNASDQPSCGTLVISSQGHIKCANCGTVGNWEQWRFKSSESGVYSYATSSREFLRALQIAAGMYSDSSNSRDIIMRLTVYLMRNQ